MATVGPNAVLRIQGREEHDTGTINWDISKEKTYFVPIGKNVADRATSGPTVYTWTAEVQTNNIGTTAIDWEAWCKDNEEHPLVVTNGGRTERLIDCMVDSVGNAVEREAGTWTKSISGKAKDHAYE